MSANESNASLRRARSPQSTQPTLTVLAAVSLPLVVGFCILVAVAACRQFQPHTPDKQLLDFNRANRGALARLAQLSLKHPEIARMWKGHLELKDGREFKSSDYSDPSWVELDGVLKQLPLVGGTLVCKERVFIYNLCRGVAPGSCKGYLFSRQLPAPLIESLDQDPPARLDNYKRAYRRIDDNWYLVYEVFRGQRNSDTGCLGTFEAPISNGHETNSIHP
jgi:hypothetical protein